MLCQCQCLFHSCPFCNSEMFTVISTTLHTVAMPLLDTSYTFTFILYNTSYIYDIILSGMSKTIYCSRSHLLELCYGAATADFAKIPLCQCIYIARLNQQRIVFIHKKKKKKNLVIMLKFFFHKF